MVDALDKTTGKPDSLVTKAEEDSLPNQEKPKVRTPKILDLRQLDMRVGRVVDVEPLEYDEGNFTLSINVKTSKRKITASGLLAITGIDMYDLIDTKVVTVVNGPVINLHGIIDCDIKVLAGVKLGGEDGTVPEAVELLKPPKKSKAGSRILAEGFVQDLYWSIKPKYYDKIIKELRVDGNKRAVYRGVPLKVVGSEGYLTTSTLTDCSITHI